MESSDPDVGSSPTEPIIEPQPVRCGLHLIVLMALDAAVRDGLMTAEDAVRLLGLITDQDSAPAAEAPEEKT